MATSAEIQSEIASLKAQSEALYAQSRLKYKELEAKRSQLSALINQSRVGLSNEQIANIIRQQDALRLEIQTLSEEESTLATQAGRIDRQVRQLEFNLGKAQEAEKKAAEQAAQNSTGSKTDSAGAAVTESQQAQTSGSGTITPPEPVPAAPAPSNAIPTPVTTPGTDGDTGTNAPLRPNSQTQATDSQQPINTGRLDGAPPNYDPNADPGSIESIYDRDTGAYRVEISGHDVPGASAAGDDRKSNATPSEQTNSTRTKLDSLYGSAIIAQDNILDNFASYTYTLGWYLVDPDAYKRLVNNQKKDIKGYYLLAQSGGISVASNTTGAATSAEQRSTPEQNSPEITAATPGRNQFFPYDYYIDDLETEILFSSGNDSNSAAAFKTIKFSLTEPNGITLLPNLYRACEDLIKNGGKLTATDDKINYSAAMFCMVIRFYGYDENGVLQAPIRNVSGNVDSRAVIEKFIPFTIKKIDFSVGPQLVEYTIEGALPEVKTGLATNRGSIPQDFDFSGVTVKDLLVGSTQSRASAANVSGIEGRSQSQSPNSQGAAKSAPTADSAPKPVTNTVATGLVAALTQFQARLLKEGKIEHVDVYEIKFGDSIISDATTAPPGGLNKNRVGGTPSTTAAEKKLPEKSSMSPSVRARGVRAGTQIVQFIDEVVRTSSYILDQQAVIYDEKTKKYKQNGKPAQQFAWFNITSVAEPLAYDRKRKDYAYKMTYYVTPYEVPMVSEYFAPSGFRGAHKIYNYIFTGQNTQVLHFDQSFDKLWTQALTADTNILEQIKNQKLQMNSREQWVQHYFAASGQSNQGGEGKVFEAGANAADFLYGPNYGKITMSIIGDPAWIPSAQYEYNTDKFSTEPFWPDGAINNTASIPYFEFAWNRPVDYNLTTGLMDPGQKNYFANRDKGQAGLATESQTYVASRCKSFFKGGKFTQELEGAWMYDQTTNQPANERKVQDPPKKVAPKVAAVPAGPDQSAAETARLAAYKPPVRIAGDNSSLGKGVQQILSPVTKSLNPSVSQIQSSQAYITARRDGMSASAAYKYASEQFANGTAGDTYAPVQAQSDAETARLNSYRPAPPGTGVMLPDGNRMRTLADARRNRIVREP